MCLNGVWTQPPYNDKNLLLFLFIFYPQKPKRSQLSSHFDLEQGTKPPTVPRAPQQYGCPLLWVCVFTAVFVHLNGFKGVVDWFFSRLDCVYGVQSSMYSCLFFLKPHYFSHNLPNFHTSLSLLWQTPRFISWFYEAPPSENAMGWDWLAGSVCCDSLNHQYVSERPAPRLSACAPVEL